MSMMPKNCPSCGFDLIWSESKVDLLCQNPFCPAQILYKIEHFLRTLGVEELTSVTLEKFNLKSIVDVYWIDEEFWLSLEGWKERKTKIIMNQLHKSLKDVHIAKLIAAFGIPNVGVKLAEKLINYIKRKYSENDPYKLMEMFFQLDVDEFLLVEGLGCKIAENIILHRKNYKDIYLNLLDKGLVFKLDISGPLKNLNIVMTGASSDGTKRPVLERMIEELGGINGKSISKSTNILVCDDLNSNSSKMKKAKELKIEIITYEMFFERIQTFKI